MDNFYIIYNSITRNLFKSNGIKYKRFCDNSISSFTDPTDFSFEVDKGIFEKLSYCS